MVEAFHSSLPQAGLPTGEADETVSIRMRQGQTIGAERHDAAETDTARDIDINAVINSIIFQETLRRVCALCKEFGRNTQELLSCLDSFQLVEFDPSDVERQSSDEQQKLLIHCSVLAVEVRQEMNEVLRAEVMEDAIKTMNSTIFPKVLAKLRSRLAA